MAPRQHRKQARHQIVEHSDYDSEVFLTDHNGSARHAHATSIVQKPPARTNEELNLTVLQRHDPDVQQILSVAPFAVVYYFSSTSQTWEKSGVEGTLFVSQLTPEAVDESHVIERFGVTVMNRKGLHNFSTELRSAGDVDITDEYVILQVEGEEDEESGEAAGGGRIYGLWIFSEGASSTEHAREINAQVIMECALRSGRSREEAYGAVEDASHGYGDDQGSISHDEQPSGYHNGHDFVHEIGASKFQQPVELAAPQQGQQIDLLSLFGSRSGPPAHNGQENRPPPQQHAYQHFGASGGGPVGLPHAHPPPAPPTQATQAQNLLSLFRR